MEASEIIRLLKLEPLPGEGGYFRRTYQSERVHPAAFFFPQRSGQRCLATAIYYLVTPHSFSALHRLDQDELFHFCLGDPVDMLQLDDTGRAELWRLGPDLIGGDHLQVCVPGPVWQGTRLREGGRWALLSVTVVPGYDDADFQLGDRGELVRRYPQHEALIRRFTRDSLP